MNSILEYLSNVDGNKVPGNLRFTTIPAPNTFSFETVEITFNSKVTKLVAEYQTEPRLMHLPNLNATNTDIGPILLIADHISVPVKEELRKARINYVDAAGNMYIDNDHILIFIDGQKRKNKIEGNKNRAFTKTGLKVVFAFLQEFEIINLPYRTIADKLDVALDTVHNVISGLKELDYLIPVAGKKLELNNTRQLLMRWIQEYDMKLKPGLLIGNFRFVNDSSVTNWEQIRFQSRDIQWGGEPGGALITNFLRPEEYTLYTTKARVEVMKELKLVPDVKGNVKLYKKFWTEEEDVKSHAPEILVYADLLNHGDSRNAEIAQRIDEQYLQSRFK